MKHRPIVGFFVLAAALSVAAWQLKWPGLDPANPYGMEFESIGCSGEWPENLPIDPIIKREVGSKPSFFVWDPVTCGMEVKEPRYELNGNSIVLLYTLHVPGPIAACHCEYKSRFTFEHLPTSVKSVSFNHRNE